ncbi:GerAB/ArcD/ProY family transporter [Tepidibacter formicigenes]|jgi:spore germination protein KB|uniref:Spore germination protein KB n=1 Tax=Tepidibacter formicigenes DSM 15518 TaxID=1123349 RepID=A0A1M6PKA5_9FIRM|nr:endospore germination permease [Tepidibacter formicigenes]SHK08348.1 spore germination protein KB [Tepidibacter formicigenes DSM 15518]
MNKEVISDKQGLFIIIMFILGNSAIMIEGLEAKQDLWIAIILSILLALPIILISARLHQIFLEKDLFYILEICFGKITGKFIILLYTWFVFHTEVLIFRNYSQFVNAVALTETPLILPIIAMGILCAWIVKEGIETLGRVAEFFSRIVITFLILSMLMLIPVMNIDNIFPVLFNGIKPIIKGAFSTLSFPFAQLFIFTMIFSNIINKSHYKIYITGLIIGGSIIFLTSTSIILVLGANKAQSLYFPTRNAFSKINIGNLIDNLEILIAVLLPVGTFIKGSVYLLATCKGITRIFGFDNYRFIVIPMTLLIINVSYFIHNSIIDLFDWMGDIWPYYTFPFQVILPIIIWIFAEVKKNNLLS